MKNHFTLFLSILFLNSSAQIIQLGQAIVTSEGAGPAAYVMRVLETRNPQNAPLGYDWATSRYANPQWTKGSNTSPAGCQGCTGLGNVFGIAYDNSTPATIFVAATNIYMSTSYGFAGAGGIYKIDGVTGSPSKLTNTSATFIRHDTSSVKAIWNTGSGLGNICYATDSKFIFATNFEDGKIYRINSANGLVSGTYDPFNDDNKTAGYCPLGERIWGIGYYGFRLYFARWSEDAVRKTTGLKNGIYSIALDSTTLDFTGTINADGSFSNAIEQLEIEGGTPLLPDFPYNLSQYAGTTASYPNLNTITAPVSDIEFSTDGKMLIAERSMPADKVTSNFDFHAAHFSRVFEFQKSNGNWQSTNNFFVGNIYSSTNSAGGTDYGYGIAGCDSTTNMIYADSSFALYLRNGLNKVSNCEQKIWSTGDGLRYPAYNPVSNNSTYANTIYGIAGIPVTGNSNITNDSAWIKTTSIYVDFDSVWNVPKASLGDVDIYRLRCSVNDCQHTSISSLAEENFGSNLYPNPANNMLVIDFLTETKSPSTIQMLDASGKTITELMSQKNKETIDLGGLESGLYLVKVTREGKSKTIRVSVVK